MKSLGTQNENLDPKAYLIIKNMTNARKLFPDEIILQEKLTKELGTSRTPLIGALKYLVNEKRVDAIPLREFYVRLFNTSKICYRKPEKLSESCSPTIKRPASIRRPSETKGDAQ